MGGVGSGRWPGESGRKTTDDLLALDVRELKREGHISPGQDKFIVTEGVELGLAWTPCSFGGSRPWFVCPGEKCGGRRAAILYLGELDEHHPLLCRLCHNLAYPTQREDPSRRALAQARRRVEKFKARLGVAPNEELVAKPPRMHHATFVRVGREYVKAVEEWRTIYRVYNKEQAGILQERYSRMLERMEREEKAEQDLLNKRLQFKRF